MDDAVKHLGCSILILILLAGCSLQLVPTHQLEWSPIAGEIPTSQPAADPELEP